MKNAASSKTSKTDGRALLANSHNLRDATGGASATATATATAATAATAAADAAGGDGDSDGGGGGGDGGEGKSCLLYTSPSPRDS